MPFRILAEVLLSPSRLTYKRQTFPYFATSFIPTVLVLSEVSVLISAPNPRTVSTRLTHSRTPLGESATNLQSFLVTNSVNLVYSMRILPLELFEKEVSKIGDKPPVL